MSQKESPETVSNAEPGGAHFAGAADRVFAAGHNSSLTDWLRDSNQRDTLSASLFRRVMFSLMTGMMKKNTWKPRGRQHWEAQGWLRSVRPT